MYLLIYFFLSQVYFKPKNHYDGMYYFKFLQGNNNNSELLCDWNAYKNQLRK